MGNSIRRVRGTVNGGPGNRMRAVSLMNRTAGPAADRPYSGHPEQDLAMNEQATASDSPFIQGRNARLYGKSIDECPYAEGSEDRAAWIQAYEEAATDDPAA